MKQSALFLFAIVLVMFSSQVFSQTYGIYAEKDIYITDGNMATDTLNVMQSIETGVTAYKPFWFVGADSSYFGKKAVHVKFDGKTSGDNVMFRAIPVNPNYDVAQYPKWKGGEFVFFVKLLAPMDVTFIVQTYRPDKAGGVHESDEFLSNHGMNTNLLNVWQKIYFDPAVIEGRVHDVTGYDYIGLRSRGFATNLLLDEVYMDYSPMKTYGIFADSSKFTSDGKLSTAPTIQNGAIVDTVASSSIVPGPYGPKGAGKALRVTFAGGNSDYVKFSAPAGLASFPRWNDSKANLVLYIKLIDTLDVAIEFEGMRVRDHTLNGSDELLSHYGLNVKNTTEWQRIVLDLANGLDKDKFDFSQFQSFNLRSRNNKSKFYVDEIYVRYPSTPTSGVNDKASSVPTSSVLDQNYPNPFNPTTKISFTLTEGNYTTLRVYNLLGQPVANLVSTELTPGYHQVTFNASELSAGMYFYRIESGNFSQVRKMLLLK